MIQRYDMNSEKLNLLEIERLGMQLSLGWNYSSLESTKKHVEDDENGLIYLGIGSDIVNTNGIGLTIEEAETLRDSLNEMIGLLSE